MTEATPTHQVIYRKNARSTWKELENACFLSLNDAEILADQLVKVVLAVSVKNSRTGEIEYEA